VLAYDYPLLGVFWTMLYLFLLFLWIWLLIAVFADIFRSHDLGGWGKALWTIFVVVLPFLGILVYLIARGGSMHERAEARAARQEEDFQAYVQEAAGSSTNVDQLAKLADLKASGALSEEEFQAQKAKLLA
jgi:hypothetical protein